MRNDIAVRRRNIYVALEDLDFVWDEDDVEEVKGMWRCGVPIDYIAKNFDRDVTEIVVLIIDLRKNGFIENRLGGWLGIDVNGEI